MLEGLKKYQNLPSRKYNFSVLIPSWNNLEYLKLCISGLIKNSSLDLQIIVFVNEGNDGTLEWLAKQKNIDYLHSKKNIGICYGLNLCRSIIKSDYIIYLNDDMYVLPNWDIELYKEIEKLNTKLFMLSATMIEPYKTKNPCIINKNFGIDINSFKEDEILKEYSKLTVNDWCGSTWPPNVLHVDLWDSVGGLSIEFSPGMYSDPDLSKKLFNSGVRIFKGKGTSLVYHFGSKSTSRIKKNSGRKQFILKWGITSRTFTNNYLLIGKDYQKIPDIPKLSIIEIIINKLKRMIYS